MQHASVSLQEDLSKGKIKWISALFVKLEGNSESLIITLMPGQGGDWDKNKALQWEGTVSGVDCS